MNISTLRRHMMLRAIAVTFLSAIPACAFAQSAADAAPSESAAQTPATKPSAGRRFAKPPASITDQEIDEASPFMRDHSPNRWNAADTLPERDGLRRSVMSFILARYRSLEAIKDEDPKLYAIKLKELTVEDQIFGLIGHTQTRTQREPLRTEIREQTRQLVQLIISERQHRIDRLRANLKAQEELLAADTSHLDALADRRTQILIDNGAAFLRLDSRRKTGPATRPASRPAQP